jgi:drug/metabolite transporter (DMT)-like permease
MSPLQPAPSRPPAPNGPLLALVGASLLWGLAWLPLKRLEATGIAGVPLSAVAFGAAALVLLPLLWRSRSAWSGQARWLLLIGLLGGYANLSFTLALIQGEVVRVMVLFYLLPVWAVIGGRLFLGEAVDGPRALAVVLALTGAFLVLGGPATLDGGWSWADALALSCGISFAGNNLVFRARQSLPMPAKVTAMLAGCFALALLAAAVTAPEAPSPHAAAWAAAYGLGWVLVATAGTQWGVTHLEAGRAAVIIILELVVAVLSAVLIGGENLSGAKLLGCGFILVAAWLEARRG